MAGFHWHKPIHPLGHAAWLRRQRAVADRLLDWWLKRVAEADTLPSAGPAGDYGLSF